MTPAQMDRAAELLEWLGRFGGFNTSELTSLASELRREAEGKRQKAEAHA